MRTLNEELAKRGRRVDYVLVSHTEPDHSGAQGSAAGQAAGSGGVVLHACAVWRLRTAASCCRVTLTAALHVAGLLTGLPAVWRPRPQAW